MSAADLLSAGQRSFLLLMGSKSAQQFPPDSRMVLDSLLKLPRGWAISCKPVDCLFACVESPAKVGLRHAPRKRTGHVYGADLGMHDVEHLDGFQQVYSSSRGVGHLAFNSFRQTEETHKDTPCAQSA